MIKVIGDLNVTVDRLFTDYSTNGKLNLTQFVDLYQFIRLGINKIQIKRIFNHLDK